MIEFEAVILKFKEKAEKTGWKYLEIPASQIKPGTNQIYRVKVKLDNYKIESVAILPMGKGNFIIPVNEAMRKGTGKSAGDTTIRAVQKVFNKTQSTQSFRKDRQGLN